MEGEMSKKQSRTEKRKAAEEAKKAPLTAYKDPPCEGCPVTACPVGVDQGSDLCTALRGTGAKMPKGILGEDIPIIGAPSTLGVVTASEPLDGETVIKLHDKADEAAEGGGCILPADVTADIIRGAQTCTTCGKCDVKNVGFCEQPVAREQLDMWNGVIFIPEKFGCLYWEPRKEE